MIFLGNEYDYYDSDLDRPQTGMSFQQSDYSPGISDDEFESVSQVQGPVSIQESEASCSKYC